MRPTHRQILVSLTFLAPLGLLAWVGGEELRRQADRTELAQRMQSVTFLDSVARELELQLDLFLESALDADQLALMDRNWVQVVRERSEAKGPWLRDIFLLDDLGQMIFPQSPPTDLGLPLADSPRPGEGLGRGRSRGAGELFAAEALHVRGQLVEARNVLERYLERRPGSTPPSLQRLRARMQLAAILRQQGHAEGAAEIYRVLIDDLDFEWATWDPDRGAFYFATLWLAAAVGLAEVEDDAHERLDLMSAISTGIYDDVADWMLGSVMERLMGGIPTDDEYLQTEARDALNTDRYRFDGRRFAAGYEQLAAETVRRRLLRQEEGLPYEYEVYTDDEGSWLLAMRRATLEEYQSGAGWVGVRVDLVLALPELMDPFLEPDEAGFTLSILDSDGLSVMPTEELPSQVELSTRGTPYGLQLRAIPGDPEAFRSANQASVQNRALLIVFLVLVAGGGAFFLWRSVGRESELAQLKVDLVSRVSHELKTPLSLIRLYGDTLAMGRTRDQTQVTQFAGVITRESERLSNMIGRILDFSRQQAGTLKYEKQPVELGGLITAVTDAYRPHVEAQGASLETELARDLVVNVDTDAMEGAVLNLMENAVKYTPPDAPDRTIRVALRRNNGRAVLEIIDRGIGIPLDERDRVLDSFFRASNAGEARGAGLGLSLVHHFVQAHGGSIEIAGRAGGGTTLRLVLPLVIEEEKVTNEESDGKAT